MTEPIYSYDETSDTLAISFAPGERATGIELTDHILLRVNKRDQSVVGITLLDYSLLTQMTDVGPRSFPVTGLAELSAETRTLILGILKQPSVKEILTLSTYTPSPSENIPIVLVNAVAAGATA